MKKLLLICAFALAGVTTTHANVGLGVVFGGGAGWDGFGGSWGAGFSFAFGELERVTWEFAVRAGGGNRHFTIAVDADYHLFQWDFGIEWFGLYIGVGPYVGMDIWSARSNRVNKKDGGGFGLDLGARVPVGVRFYFAKHFDIWLGLVPNIGIRMGFGDRYHNDRFGIGGGIGGELGFRFWF